MEFDKILVNPPFRNTSGNSTKTAPGGGRRNLYTSFAYKYIDLIKNTGTIYAITPPGIFKSTNHSRCVYLDYINDSGFFINMIDLDENKKYFNVGSPICSWMVSSKNTDIEVSSIGSKMKLKQNIDYIPVICNETIVSIINKMHNLNQGINLEIVRERNPDTFTGGISFGSLLSGNNNIKIYTDRSFLHKSGCLSIETNKVRTYKKLFESSLFKFWFIIHRYNGSIYRSLMNRIKIPEYDFDITSDDDVFNMYSLNKFEIEYVKYIVDLNGSYNKYERSTIADNLSNNLYTDHARNREYMSGIERDTLRIKQTNEVFTPTPLVQEMLDKLEEQDPTTFTDPTKTFLDNSCGDGQFLSEIVIRKMERSGCSLEQALSTTYGVEFMEDNVLECRARLAGPNPTQEVLDIVENNIVHHDALTYHYMFGEEKKRYLF